MARITEMPKGITPVWIHDVSNPVGLKWYNHRDDVKLLQYALNQIMAKKKLSDRSARPTPGPMGPEYPALAPLEVDGVFGNKSCAALVAYQRAIVCGGMCTLVDGMVDPVYKYIGGLGGDPIGARNMTIMTKVTQFTMFKLNNDILQLYGTMMSDEDLPQEVQVALRAQGR